MLVSSSGVRHWENHRRRKRKKSKISAWKRWVASEPVTIYRSPLSLQMAAFSRSSTLPKPSTTAGTFSFFNSCFSN